MVKVFGPLVEMARLQNEINKIFETVLDVSPEESLKAASGWLPSVDVVQTDDTLTVSVELPGVELSGVTLAAGSGQLIVKGEKPRPPAVRHGRFHCLERAHGAFSRTVILPVPVNTHQARAVLKEGLLTVVFPRVSNRRGQPIEIPVHPE